MESGKTHYVAQERAICDLLYYLMLMQALFY